MQHDCSKAVSSENRIENRFTLLYLHFKYNKFDKQSSTQVVVNLTEKFLSGKENHFDIAVFL